MNQNNQFELSQVMGEQFKFSGKYNLKSLLMQLLWVIPLMIGLSIIYNYICKWIPLAYFNILGTFAYGILIGLCGYVAIKMSHTRNKVVLTTMMLILGILGLYFAWIFFFVVQLKLTYADGFKMIFQLFVAFDMTSNWFIKGKFYLWRLPKDVQGSWLYFLTHSIEALLIIGVPIFSGRLLNSREAYCEDCQEWLDENKEIIIEDVCDKLWPDLTFKEQNKFLRNKVKNLEVNELLTAQQVQDKDSHLRCELKYCNNCKKFAILNVSRKKIFKKEQEAFNKKFETETEQEATIVAGICIPSSILKNIINNKNKGV
ncbi:hypothetical protein AAEX28_07995 [Lentisphaerota bacterium WC36G]|nr:hypothetical protein LJT99_10850 [Lentisphaerae bacterium WC36]